MPKPRSVALVSSLVAGVALVSSCAAPATVTPPPHRPEAPKAASPELSERAARKARAPIPQRPAPPVVTTAMKGEPTGAAMSEARLVATSCEQASNEDLEARLKEMRAAVDASF